MRSNRSTTTASGPGPSPDRSQRLRANRVDERVALGVALVSAVVAALAGVRPTGSTVVDVVLVGLAVGAATWAAASAPWWAVAGSAAVASIVAIDPLLTLAGVPAFVAGLWIGLRRQDLSTGRVVVAAVALNLLARSELQGFLGESTIVALACGLALFVLGVRRRPRRHRRRAYQVLAVVAVVVVLAGLGFTVSAASARSDLADGNRLAQQGIVAVGDGRFAEAADAFASASTAFDAAHDSLRRPWAQGARIVPALAQNARAARELADQAAASSARLGEVLRIADVDGLRLVDGRIDLAAVAAVEEPLRSVAEDLDALSATIDDVDSPWLLAPVSDRIAAVEEDIAANEASLDNAILAVDVLPGMLGADGPRRYFIAFTTPAEARGLGGFMGNFAEFVADGGQLTMTRFGRTTELNLAAEAGARTVTGPEDWLVQYGRYGFNSGPNGTVSAVPWSNITMSPHFPSVAQVIAELYPQSGGAALDGVFVMDPFVLAELVELTGPVQVPSTGQVLEGEQVVPFLLTEQYAAADNVERIDLLEEVAEQAIDQVLAGALPEPTLLAESLGQPARAGRLVGWSATPAEQDLFQRINLSGALPTLGGADGVAVVVNNAAANKIDVYLERDVRYQSVVDPSTGRATGTLEVTLRNTAPASGLPPVVIGNAVDQPPGTNRALVSLYTALPVLSATIDGEPLLVETGREQDWRTARAMIDVPPGGSRTITLEVGGELDLADGYTIVTRPQPLVAPERHQLSVATDDGDGLVTVDEVATEPRRHAGPGS